MCLKIHLKKTFSSKIWVYKGIGCTVALSISLYISAFLWEKYRKRDFIVYLFIYFNICIIVQCFTNNLDLAFLTAVKKMKYNVVASNTICLHAKYRN